MDARTTLRSMVAASVCALSPLANGQQVALQEDFESGFAGWTATGLWNPEASTDTCGSLAAPFPAGNTAAYWGGVPGCNYASPSTIAGNLTRVSPTHIPAGWDVATLRFWSFEATEIDTDYDRRLIFVSADGGATWDQVAQAFGVNDFLGWLIDDLTISNECLLAPAIYCSGLTNSTGLGASIGWSGSTRAAANDFHLTASQAPPNQFGMFYYGPEALFSPFGDGLRCVGAGSTGVSRLYPAAPTDSAGAITRFVDLALPPASAGPGAIAPGDTWNFQFWYRDPLGPGGSGFNLSNALEVVFCP